MLIAYFRRSECVSKCGYWLNRFLNFPMTMSYLSLHNALDMGFYWSFLCSKPTRRSSNPHLLIVSCAGSYLLCMGLVHTAELRGTLRERWFVSRSSICRFELGFYVWVDLSLPFLPLTHVKIKNSFIYYSVCCSAQSSWARAGLLPCKV